MTMDEGMSAGELRRQLGGGESVCVGFVCQLRNVLI